MSPPRFRYRGLAYRAHHPRWSFAPTSGEGAKRHGGRFNRPGREAFYCSIRPETAWIEAQQGFPFKPQPLLLCAYDVDCADLVDLTDAMVREALGPTLLELGCAWEDLADRGRVPPTWALAERLIADSCAGIRVRSFAPGARSSDHNLVFWDWSEAPPRQLRLIDDEARLPRDDRSWR